jgi:protein-tyrosine phosphatase
MTKNQMNNKTDYHCHLLPGIDDGPQTIDESIRMSKLLSNAGYAAVHCTPHLIKTLYDADNHTVRHAIKALQQKLDEEGIPLHLLSGREYYLDNHFHEFLEDLMPLEGTNYLLIEFPPDTYPGMIQDTFSAILRKGLIPMVAHPERYCSLNDHQEKKTFGIFHRKHRSERIKPDNICKQTELLEHLSSINCAFQCNLGSFIGAYGKTIQETAMRLRAQGICTHYGTDAHSPEILEKIFEVTTNGH